jgi:hypothetical protein
MPLGSSSLSRPGKHLSIVSSLGGLPSDRPEQDIPLGSSSFSRPGKHLSMLSSLGGLPSDRPEQEILLGSSSVSRPESMHKTHVILYENEEQKRMTKAQKRKIKAAKAREGKKIKHETHNVTNNLSENGSELKESLHTKRKFIIKNIKIIFLIS